MFEFKQHRVGTCENCGKPIIAVNICGAERILPCKCRTEQIALIEKKQEQEQRIKSSLSAFKKSVGERFKDKSFSNYIRDVKGFDKNHWNAMQKLTKDFPSFLKSGKGYMLLGQCGCGKTHLEVSVGKALISQGYTVRFFKMNTLFNEYKKTFMFSSQETSEDFIHRICQSDLIILDDLGIHTAEKDKGFEEFLYSLIDYRYLQKKPVLISSNIPMTELNKSLSVKVADRLRAMISVVMNNNSSMRKYE